MNKIRQFTAFLSNRRNIINKVVPWFLMGYFIINCLPYLFARVPSLNNLFSNSTFSYVLRFGALGLFCIYGLVLMIVNKCKINRWLIIVLAILTLLSFISNFSSPDNVVSYSMYFTGKIQLSEWRIGVYDKLLDAARFSAGCLSFYFLYSAYPSAFKKKEQFTYVVLPAIIIAAIGVLYTLTAELRTFIAVINNQTSPEAVRSIFHSKNAFGIFLFEGAAAAIYIFFTDRRLPFRLTIILLPVFLIISYLINCKLAAVCILILLLLTIVYSVIYYFNKRRWVSITILGVVALFSIFIILIFSINSFHSSGFLATIYNKIIDAFKNFNISSFIGRTVEWTMVPRMTNGIFMWIGFAGSVGYSVIYSYTGMNGSNTNPVSDLHNAYVDFYAYHGIIGCLALLVIYGVIGYYIYKLFKRSKNQALLIIVLFFVSILFGMAETYTLFVSISANTFVLNFLLVVPLLFYLNNQEVNNNEI